MKCDEVKERVIKTNIERYGSEYYTQTDEFKEKSRNTIIDKHGSLVLSYKERVDKSKQTKLTRYGDKNYHNVDQMVKSQIEKYGGLWGNKTSVKYSTSKGEKEVLEFIKSIYSGTVIENDRTQMTPNDENGWIENHELDIWLPEINSAIEYNGTYWHSLPKIIESDKFKKLQCESKGIRLLTITESDWTNDLHKCKSKIIDFLKW